MGEKKGGDANEPSAMTHTSMHTSPLHRRAAVCWGDMVMTDVCHDTITRLLSQRVPSTLTYCTSALFVKSRPATMPTHQAAANTPRQRTHIQSRSWGDTPTRQVEGAYGIKRGETQTSRQP
jgi:hypothetical protein